MRNDANIYRKREAVTVVRRWMSLFVLSVLVGSALLTPLPTLHADAGAGWYNTTFDYKNPLLRDETKQKFGVHVGGGLRMPFTPITALDLTGRYVWLQKQESRLVPQKFDPNFWTMSLGLAIKL